MKFISLHKGKKMKTYLYRFKNENNDNDIFLLSSYIDEKQLRNVMHIMDHGGMPFEEFKKVWQTGKIEKITSIKQIKNQLNKLPFVSDELDNVELYLEEIIEEMNGDDFINVNPWDWNQLYQPYEKETI